jgi:two-component system cell cycle response regulator DivK
MGNALFNEGASEDSGEGLLDPKRILIVEDEEGNIAVISSILELVLGQQELFVARDGHEAIRMAYTHHPDIILMDLLIPKLDGWQVARSLKSTQEFRNTPILAVTAQAMVGDREKALQAGCDAYFVKPIEVDEFVRFVRPYLGTSRVEA